MHRMLISALQRAKRCDASVIMCSGFNLQRLPYNFSTFCATLEEQLRMMVMVLDELSVYKQDA